jgi:sulfonate transport system substrate-binding protein
MFRDDQRTSTVRHRFRRRLARSWIWIFSACVLAIGCSRTGESQTDVVRIGYQKTGTLNLLRLRATLTPDLARLGVRVEWIGFPAGPQLIEALNAGAIDFGHTGDAPPILAQAAGVPFVYVGHEPSRPHAEAVIVPAGSSLRTPADLRGKRVALNKGSNVHYLVARVLESAGVPYDEVQAVFLAPSDARAAFEGGAVDAWAVWDPYLAEAEIHAGARVLVDAAQLVTNREFHLASRQLSHTRPDAIRAIIAALKREGQWADEHRNEVATILAGELGLEAAVMERVISRKVFGIAPISDDVLVEQQKIADVFFKLRLIAVPIVVREAFVPGLASGDPAHETAVPAVAVK